MHKICQHCGTGFSEKSGVNGFCCSGCEQVYHLIQEQGFDDFYQMQDRNSQPIGSQPLEGSEFEWAETAQAAAENSNADPRLELSLSGMSCAGCVWLVERIGHRADGVISVKVRLDQQSVILTWSRNGFSLASLVREWQRYGYVTEIRDSAGAMRLSPLAWRSLLCALFAGNAWLLSAFQQYELGGTSLAGIIRLFALLCAVLSLIVGASLFVLPVFQRLRMRHWHYDILPTVGIVLWFVSALLQSLMVTQSVRPYLYFSVGIFVLVGVRWLQRSLWSFFIIESEAPQSWVWRWLRSYTFIILVMSIFGGIFISWQAALASLLASSLYPMAMSVGYRPNAAMIAVGFMMNISGVILAYMGLLSMVGATLWVGVISSLWILLFSYLKGCFPRKEYPHA